MAESLFVKLLASTVVFVGGEQYEVESAMVVWNVSSWQQAEYETVKWGVACCEF